MKHLNPKAFSRSAHLARWRMMLLLWGMVLLTTQAFSQRAQISLPITWQDSATTDLTTTDFGGTISSLQADPANASRLALRIIKDQTAQTWAGTTLSTHNGLAASIPFASNANLLKVVVYAPASGVVFRLKAEDKNDPTKSVETEATTTVANAWDTLTFNFANQATGTAAINYGSNFDKISIFPNFGIDGATAGTQTYFIGYVNHVPASGGGGGGTTRAQISLPITWQDSSTTDLTTVDFGGTISSLQADPTNATRVALRIVKDATAQTWAGTTLSTANGLAANIPFAANANLIKVQVYSPAAGLTFRLKAEDKNDPTKSVETDVTTTVANAWDTLTFDFANHASGTQAINYATSYNKLSIFPNFGNTGTTQTFFIGYVNHVPASGGGGGGTTRAQISLPITWQDSSTTDLTTVDFGGTVSSLQADPTNATRVALRIVKDATAQTWAGTTLSTANGLAANIPFAANANKMQVVVYSPAAGLTFRLKAEDKNDPTKSVETDVTTTVANAWDTLTFDFASQSAGTAAINYSYSYNKLSIFPNFGNTGTTQTFFIGYVNHVPASGGGGGGTTRAQIRLPITWQDSTTTDLTTVDFGGTISSLQADPTNANRVALRIVKDATAQTWAGTTLSTANGLAANIPFAANANKMQVVVYSPAAGLTFRLKAEDKNDPTKSVETDVTTTVANAWDTLTFDFASQSAGTAAINYSYSYNKLSIFPNFGNTGTTQTFFIGYVNHVPASGGGGGGTTRAQISLPITWQDSATTDLTTTDFGGTISSLQADPTNATRVALRIVKDATAQTWAGTTLSTPNGLAANIPFAANANKMQVVVYSPATGVQFKLKAEDKNDPTKSVETDVTTTVANAWDTLTFDFASQSAGTAAINYSYSYNKLSIFPNFGNTGTTQTFFIGYVNHVPASGGGGGGTTRAQISLPITWQDSATTDLTTTDFGGTISSLQADPTNATRVALRIVKDATAQTWAGTTLSTANGLAANIPFAANANKMQVVVYSPATGVQFKLKAEDKNDPTKSVETDVTTTVANAWDTLTFDFASQSAGTAAINYSYSYNKLSIFPNFGNTGTTQTFFIGYVNHVPASGGGGGGTTRAQISLPITWQDSATTDLTTVDFGGTISSLQADPTNANRVALRIVKDATAQTWAGTTLSTANGLAANIPFAANANLIKVQVYSPAAGLTFRLKAEDKNDPTKSVETDVTTTVANAWDTLTFDFASQSAGTAAINYSYSYNKLSIFPNFGNTGTTQTFFIGYVNHVPASGGGGGGTTRAQIRLPITWQDSATTDLTTVDFGGTISSLQADPTNATRVALRIVKDATAQTWAGTTLSTPNGLAANIPFAANANKMQVVVYSPATGVQFKLKAEDKNDPTKSVETDVTTTVANAWDTLTFDFASQSAGTAAINYSYSYNKLSIFPNFGNTGTTQTFFIGYVNHVPASGGGGGGTTRAQISLPITWQDSATTDLTTTDFGGTISSLQADPTNANRVALRIVKDATAQTWAGTTLSTANGLAANIPFAANANKMQVVVYSPATGVQFKLKAEDKNDPTKSVETDVTTTVANAWDTLTFDFASQSAGTAAINYSYSYNKLSIFPNFGNTGTTQTFFIGYVNHVTGGGGGGTTRAQIRLPITWQDSATTDLTTTDFGGTISSLQADPTNATRVALRIVKDATAQTWAGTTLSTANGLAANIPFAANANLIKVQVYSPAAGLTFRLKAEDKNDPTKSVETDVTTTVANAWDTLTFNFANHASGTQAINYATSYNKLSIFPNFGNTGTTQTFFIGYINHVTGGGGGGTTRAQIRLPITWQDSATTDLTTTDFGGTISSLQADPTNATRVALRIVKDATAQTWAGTTLSTPNGLAANIPFAANANLIKVQVYSPAAGLTFRLKAEDKNDPTKSVETDVTTTVANAWDTLTFNFANHASGTQAINYATSYNKLSIFPNFGTTGTTQTFFIGYINHVTGGGGGGTTRAQIRLPITWQDSATTDLTTTDFGGTISSLQADPANATRVALRIVKDATAQTWAGTTLSTPNGLAANIPFAANANRMQVVVYSPATGLTFRLKAEDKNDPTKSVETDVTTTVANAWDTLTFNFANHASGTQAINYATSYNKLSIFPNFGNTGTTQTFFIGYINHVTGGGGTTRTQISLPITWQDSATTDLTTTDFGGTISSLQADPTNATRVALRIVKDATAQTWAGTTLSTPNGLAANIPFAANANLIKVQVYSPAAGLTFRLKAEDKNDPTKSVETDVTTTVANAWDTLTFNFANHASGTQAINYATSYNKLSIFPNFGNTGTTQTFFIGYVNHVTGGGGGGTTRAQIRLPITWQDSATTDLTTTDFGGTISSLQADPTNATRVALRIVKDATAQTWAGTTLSTPNGLAANIPFAANANLIKVQVYSPAAGLTFRLKAEDKNDPTKSVETDVTTTVANAWDTLTFNFANHASGTQAINYATSYNKLSIFPNFGNTGTTQTFFIGYVNHSAGGSGGGTTKAQISLPITWQDSATTDLTTTDFGGTASALAADPVSPNRIALSILKTAAAQSWAGTTFGTPNGFAANIPFTPNSNQMQVQVYAPAAGMVMRLKAEDKTDPTKSVETDATTTVANAWHTLTFNFANHASGTAAINYTTSYNKLSIFPNFNVSGATSGALTFFIGQVAFGTITGTNNLIQTGELLIYPNPNAGTFQLNAPAMEGKEVNVQLLDVSGKKVHEENIGAFANNQTLSVNGLRDGLYFCRISSGDQVVMQKLVIRN